jgi:hypothetical protein
VLREESACRRSGEGCGLTMWEYRAHIDMVVDGDTFDVEMDLSLDVNVRAALRLAGLNAALHDTSEGRAAKAYVIGEVTAVLLAPVLDRGDGERPADGLVPQNPVGEKVVLEAEAILGLNLPIGHACAGGARHPTDLTSHNRERSGGNDTGCHPEPADSQSQYRDTPRRYLTLLVTRADALLDLSTVPVFCRR